MGGRVVSELLARYVGLDFVTENAAQRALREETQDKPSGRMQLGVDPAAFLAWTVKLIGARRTIEVGTFTGYSALTVAQALPSDGKIIACDVDSETSAIARRHWAQAGVADKIDLRVAPAVDTLDALLEAGEEGRFDLAFIDADKASYDAYYERCLRLVRQGGVLAFDNVLWSGAVAEPGPKDEETRALHALNQKAKSDPRVDASLLTVGDGMLLLRKR